MKISKVFKFKPNTLLVFDQNGQQIPQYQGEATPEKIKAIFKASDENTTFDGFGSSGPLEWRGFVS